VNLLRAAAALAVVVYHVIEHAQWTAFPAAGPLVGFRVGWLGVDLFFVVSGFVIAYSALALYREAPAAFARTYWRRRLARIAPLYFLTLALWVAFLWPGFFAQPLRAWAWHLGSHLAFVHNFWPATFGSIDGPNWSLAIEMQFYLAVALLVPWIDRTPAWRIALGGVAIAWAWRAAATLAFPPTDGWHLFVRTSQFPGTLDEFAAGIVLAKWTLDRQRPGGRGVPAREAWAWVAAACVTGYAAMALYWPRASYWDLPAMVIFWRTPLALFFACVVGAAVHLPRSLADRWLAPVAYLGEISYGIYLWHLFAVMLAIEALGKRPVEVLVATLAFTLAAAALSWRYFERPFMRLARRPAREAPPIPAPGVLNIPH
jgi:peptidoglycan/LPS O-acetylase OafA/YrhL